MQESLSFWYNGIPELTAFSGNVYTVEQSIRNLGTMLRFWPKVKTIFKLLRHPIQSNKFNLNINCT